MFCCYLANTCHKVLRGRLWHRFYSSFFKYKHTVHIIRLDGIAFFSSPASRTRTRTRARIYLNLRNTTPISDIKFNSRYWSEKQSYVFSRKSSLTPWTVKLKTVSFTEKETRTFSAGELALDSDTAGMRKWIPNIRLDLHPGKQKVANVSKRYPTHTRTHLWKDAGQKLLCA